MTHISSLTTNLGIAGAIVNATVVFIKGTSNNIIYNNFTYSYQVHEIENSDLSYLNSDLVGYGLMEPAFYLLTIM